MPYVMAVTTHKQGAVLLPNAILNDSKSLLDRRPPEINHRIPRIDSPYRDGELIVFSGWRLIWTVFFQSIEDAISECNVSQVARSGPFIILTLMSQWLPPIRQKRIQDSRNPGSESTLSGAAICSHGF
jgi:hypothetical protein